jgi:hypothetical protein
MRKGFLALVAVGVLLSGSAEALEWGSICDRMLSRTLFLLNTVRPWSYDWVEYRILDLVRGLGGPQQTVIYGDNPLKPNFYPGKPRLHETENASLLMKTAGTANDPYFLLVDLLGSDADGLKTHFWFHVGASRLLQLKAVGSSIVVLAENDDDPRPIQKLTLILDGHGYLYQVKIQTTTPRGYLLKQWQTFEFHPVTFIKYEGFHRLREYSTSGYRSSDSPRAILRWRSSTEA